jgi:putative Holliday junction resolvase
MKILAIDFGIKKMGFALGNTETRTPVPLNPLLRKDLKRDLLYIKTIILDYEVKKIILGYPLNMNGTKNRMTRMVEEFASFLKKKLRLEIDLADERLSSFEAEESLKIPYKDYKKRKKMLDSVSALIILKNYWEQK